VRPYFPSANIDVSDFRGTIFRFPLRTPEQWEQSILVSGSEMLQYSTLEWQLRLTNFNLAQQSLVLLKKLEKIDFQVRSNHDSAQNSGQFESKWKVYRQVGQQRPERADENSPVKNIMSSTRDIISERPRGSKMSSKRQSWSIVTAFIRDDALQPFPSRAKGMASRSAERLHDFIPDVAIATRHSFDDDQPPTYYNALPLPAPTGLPVCCHGQFETSSDRRSIRIDGESGEWNKFLAASCLPHLYFVLLEGLCRHERYYSYWPSSKHAENAISHTLQSAFWLKVRHCSKCLVYDGTNSACISEVVFDARKPLPIAFDPALQVVKTLRPFSMVIYEPVLNEGLLSEGDQLSDLNVLTPSFVRELLREPLAKHGYSSINDSSMKTIFNFVLEDGSFDQLIGCHVLRVGDGEILKVEALRQESDIVYIVDEEGYRLFEEAGHRMVKPACLDPKVILAWNPTDLNVRQLNGLGVDDFLRAHLSSQPLKHFSPSEKTWLSKVWKYVSAKKYIVTFYTTIPTLALSNDEYTFISKEAWDTLPIMPSHLTSSLRKISSKLNGLYILRRTNLDDINAMEKCNCEERFLECLRRLKRVDWIKEWLLAALMDTQLEVITS
jgi:hypothetical protein